MRHFQKVLCHKELLATPLMHVLQLKSVRMINLELWSLSELKQLQADVANAITSLEERQKAEAICEIRAVAQKLGYSLDELVSAEVRARQAADSPRYRHPADEAVTWSGRGRMPRWFMQAMRSGRSPDEFLTG